MSLERFVRSVPCLLYTVSDFIVTIISKHISYSLDTWSYSKEESAQTTPVKFLYFL